MPSQSNLHYRAVEFCEVGGHVTGTEKVVSHRGDLYAIAQAHSFVKWGYHTMIEEILLKQNHSYTLLIGPQTFGGQVVNENKHSTMEERK